MGTDMTAEELANRLSLPLHGDLKGKVEGAATLEDAGAAHLSFVGSAKFFEAGQRSKAGCIIAPPDYPAAEGQTVIASPQPRAHFAQALTILYPGPALQPGIHPTAVVSPG